jgi:predicted phosphodiesterase
MARYAILSDIHANLEALEAVLADLARKRVDAIWFLGDLVVYGPEPNQCIVRLLEAIGKEDWPGTSVIGNNDLAIVEGKEPEAIAGLTTRLEGSVGEISPASQKYRDATTECHEWTAKTITSENKSLLKKITAGPANVLTNSILVHASPCDPVGMNGNYLTNAMEAEEAFWCLGKRGNDICLFGHTHLTTLFRETRTDRKYQNCELKQRQTLTGKHFPLDGGRLLINPGSVGQPRDGDSRAAYALLDDGAHTIEFHRVEYSRQETLRKLGETSLTPATVEVLQNRLKEAS